MSESDLTLTINWEPQPRQLVCLDACGLDFPFTDHAPHPAIFDCGGYGGSAGGGKTDTLLAVGIIAALKYPGLKVGFFRREFPQLEGPGGAIMRSRELISHIAKYNDQKHRWTFATGSVMQFCHCKDPADVYNYQSQQFDIILIDEATQFTEEMIDYLITRNRATVKYVTFKPFTLMSTNPGNIGHMSFKGRFIDIGSPEHLYDFRYETGVTRKHYFIRSYLKDNEILMHRDPGYGDRISTNALNRKMLLEGEWDIFAGQAFGELRRDLHLIDPFVIPRHWRRFGAYDHGFNHPFSFGKFSVDSDGNVYLYQRFKDRLKRPDQIASMLGDIKELDYIVAGHDCWSKQRDGGPSVFEQYLNTVPKLTLLRANIDRVQGAQQIRTFIAWKGAGKNDKGEVIDIKPRFFIFKPLSEVYDCLATRVFDQSRPEDVLKEDINPETGRGGDDDYDMVRYGLMSRPKPAQHKLTPKSQTFDWFMKKAKEKNLRKGYAGHV